MIPSHTHTALYVWLSLTVFAAVALAPLLPPSSAPPLGPSPDHSLTTTNPGPLPQALPFLATDYGPQPGCLTMKILVTAYFLRVAREHAWQHCAARIPLCLSGDRIHSRADAVPVSRFGCDAGPAASRNRDAADACVGSGRPPASLDRRRIRGDGYQWSAAVLRHPRPDLSEHFLSDQSDLVDLVWLERFSVSFDGLPQGC
jgi:hypothetical protein